MMKAIVVRGGNSGGEAGVGAEGLVLGEVEKPVVGAGQVLIKVVATSVNRPDVMQREGKYPPPAGASEILGLEAAGVVEEVGEGVTEWKGGERVMALLEGGGYAEYAVAWAGHAMRIPEGMDFVRAACVCETYLTAYLNLFLTAGVEERGSVLLHGGGGGVNTAGVQLCGALATETRVFVTASSGKVGRVKELGADEVIDYQREKFAERVRELTGGRGVDVILDHLGGAYFADNMRCLAVGGTLLLIGLMGGSKAEFNIAHAMVKRQRIIGSVLRSRPREEKAGIIARFGEVVLPLMAGGRVVPLVSEVMPLGKAGEAHRAMEGSEHFGKIVLEVGDG